MKDISISDNVNNVVQAKKIIDKLVNIDNRLELSNNKSNELLVKIKDSNDKSIALKEDKNKGGLITTYSTGKLYDLILQNSNASLSSSILISDLLISNNQNIKDLSEMINTLAMLSGLSFEKISETSAELDEMIRQLYESSNNNFKNSSQTKDIIISQIERARDEKKRWDNIEYNLAIINENIKTLEDSYLKEINDLKSNISQAAHLEKKVLKQFIFNKRVIIFSIGISFFNFVFIAYQLFKYFYH